MKEVIKGEELKKIIIKAIDLLCDTVSSTLGPSGNNVIINSELSPFITNDGVTIARSIESSDKGINTILEIAKEASLKTNEIVGDGTTTTLVLLQSIFKESLKENINPIILQKELNQSLNVIISKINELKEVPTEKDLISIARTSANDKMIGDFIYEVFKQMKSKYAIRLEESKTNKTYYEIKKGYNLELDDISSLYFKDQDEIILDNAYILLLDDYLNDLELISDIINESVERNEKILILVSDYDELIKKESILYYLQENKNIFLFKIPDYGLVRKEIEEDISVLSNAKIVNFNNISFNDLGKVKKVIINKNEIVIINENENVKEYLDKLKKQFKVSSNYEQEKLSLRISKLENGVATIYVGGNTKTEIKEKLMRYEDALCALEVAQNGVLPGEGISFLLIADNLEEKKLGDKIIKKAIQVPFEKIMTNIGVDYDSIKKQIKAADYKKIYNMQTNSLENIINTDILDSANVLIEALTNAVSIASLLLTTNYLVINENIKIEKDLL